MVNRDEWSLVDSSAVSGASAVAAWGIQQQRDATRGTAMSKKFWRGIADALLLAVLALQLGCSSRGSLVGRTPVPGSNIYCLREIPSADFRKNLLISNVVYGPFKRGTLGGDSSICDLIQFYTYTVSWETKDGRKASYEFDLEKLMKKLQDEKPVVATMTQIYSQPQVIFAYAPDALRIHYEVTQYQPGGVEVRNGLEMLTKPPIVTKFPVLTVPLSSPTAAPASN
jgi:hypothetical protein